MPLPRRGFLATLGAFAGAAAIPSRESLHAQAAQGWDMSWLDGLTGKHKQVFDLGDVEVGLRVVMNWLDAWQNVYGLKHPDINAVIGIASRGFPINAGDELYRKYPIGEMWKVNDPDTGKPAVRNIFADGGQSKVRPLQARGATFWMCNNALVNMSGRIGTAVGKPAPEVYTDLRAGLLAGVIVVPAHTMLLGLCQERGCTYEAI
jgi:hypothetical protein